MLALWALFLLSAMVIAWTLDIDSRLTLSGNASRVVEAEAMASSGAEVALSPTVEAGSSALHGSLGPNQSYEAHIIGEGGRLDLNWIVAGEIPQHLQILRQYLEVKGIDLNERDRMMDCLLDYVDPNDLPRLNGAESEPGYQPKNSLLQRVEDLKQVKGWEKFTARRDWDADFTIYSSKQGIDLAWASRDVLLSLPGFNEQIADRFLEYRRGPDGVDGTEDDPVLESLDPQVRLALGFTPEQFQQLTGPPGPPLIKFKDPILRVVSVGKSGDVTRTIEMIINKSAQPSMKFWKEF